MLEPRLVFPIAHPLLLWYSILAVNAYTHPPLHPRGERNEPKATSHSAKASRKTGNSG